MSFISFASSVIRRSIVLRYPFKYKQCVSNVQTTKFSSVITKRVHDVNTNVVKDVILFKYENPRFYRIMNIFAIVQYMFWTYLGIFAFKTLKDSPVDESQITEDTPWFRRINLGENKYRNTLGIVALVVGTGSLTMIWMVTLRSVRYLILNKGGKHITFVTYTPFAHNRIMKVPIENVCCKEQRTMATVQLPVKVKNKMMHYMLDMKGEFKNPILFDSTAGLFRKL